MHDGSIVIATPAQARHLVLLFHGLGSSADNFAPIGGAIARARPDAFVVSVDGHHPSTLGSGREWFSVVGITEENRPERIADAMPLFQESIAYWQSASGIGAEGTTLAGFSQGAIMALESSQIERPPAARVVALARRFAQAVRRAPTGLKFHLIHGEQDGVDGAHQLHIELDDVRLELRQQIQARVACAEVVYGGFETTAPVFLHDALEVVFIHHTLVFGDFENQVIGWKLVLPRRFQSGAQTGGGLIHRIRQKIDADAAGLVELVADLVVHLAQDFSRATAIQAPDQRFVGEYLAAAHVHDRLKRHAEIDRQRRPVLAGLARRHGRVLMGDHCRILL